MSATFPTCPTPTPWPAPRAGLPPAPATREAGDTVIDTPSPPEADRLTVARDRVLAAALLVLFAPVILVAAVVVRLTSRGSAFYVQTRTGLGGREFRIYKLRTMVCNCEAVSGPQWAVPGDSRVTPVGRVLRYTHVDELPQLLNVLKGEMGLVGPRPERPEIIAKIETAVAGYRGRLAVRPGVTGLAQLRQPADTNIAGVRRKLVYDLYYVRHRGAWLDFRLMACTAVKMLGLPPAPFLELLGVPDPLAADETHTRTTERTRA